MIRGRIIVNNINHFKDVYLHLCNMPSELFNVIRIINKVSTPDFKTVTFNFIW